MWRKVVELYANGRVLISKDWKDIPVLKGGPSNSGFFILHTDDKASEFTARLFNLTPVEEFVAKYDKSPLPQFLIPVVGFNKWPEWLLISALATGTLKTRAGLHSLAYGVNLDQKRLLFETLTKDLTGKNFSDTEEPEKKAAQMLAHFSGTMFDFISLAAPALAHASVASFVYSEMPELSEQDAYEATRMCLAITELEGQGAINNMKQLGKVSYDGIEQRLKDSVWDNAKIKLLPRFEENYAAYKKLGLVPISADAFIAKMIYGKHNSQKPKTQKRSRVGTFEARLKQFGNLIKQRGASGEDV